MNLTKRGRILLAAAIAAVAALPLNNAVGAEVYKCTNAAGRIEFTDAPCGTARTSAVVDARPNSLDNSAVREQLLKIENRSLQEKLAERQAVPATGLQEQADASRADSSACRSAKRDVEVAATSIENKRALIRARQTAMYSACGLREPDKQVTNVNVGGSRGDRRNAAPALVEKKTP